ncbi:MAG TPA: GAF and ANTAR domain-containing protein [Acidimicrobiales bacterium]|nr:GAF and ANTAR domain-containing protein [Acidimicrobiales bacterium]
MSFEVGSDEPTLEGSLQELARVLFAGRTAEATLHDVADLAQRTIPGCDAASVTIIEGGKPRTTVSTAEIAVEVDRHQYAADEGPCLEAVRSDQVIRVDSYDGESRWPAFLPAVVKSGVKSSLSLPLVAVDEAVGALNLYSSTVEAFVDAEPVGIVFAGQAAITLANASAYHKAADLARNLALALEHRDIIGQAKGILMAQDGVSSEEAFDILRRASQRSNRKVYDLAEEIVNRNGNGTGTGPG